MLDFRRTITALKVYFIKRQLELSNTCENEFTTNQVAISCDRLRELLVEVFEVNVNTTQN